jgi:hypothetical protein
MAKSSFIPRADDEFLVYHDHLTSEAGKPGSIVPAGAAPRRRPPHHRRRWFDTLTMTYRGSVPR